MSEHIIIVCAALFFFFGGTVLEFVLQLAEIIFGRRR